MVKELKITLKKSLIGKPEKQRSVVRGLGLRKLNSCRSRTGAEEAEQLCYKEGYPRDQGDGRESQVYAPRGGNS
jgi:ribosomal protein L30